MKYIIITSLFVSIQLFAGQVSTILDDNKKIDKLKITEYHTMKNHNHPPIPFSVTDTPK